MPAEKNPWFAECSKSSGAAEPAVDGLHADLIGIAKVPGERNIALQQRQFAEQTMSGDIVAATLQDPAELIARDVVLSGGNHRFGFANVILASCAARVQQLPTAIGPAAERDLRGVPRRRRGRDLAADGLCVWPRRFPSLAIHFQDEGLQKA